MKEEGKGKKERRSRKGKEMNKQNKLTIKRDKKKREGRLKTKRKKTNAPKPLS